VVTFSVAQRTTKLACVWRSRRSTSSDSERRPCPGAGLRLVLGFLGATLVGRAMRGILYGVAGFQRSSSDTASHRNSGLLCSGSAGNTSLSHRRLKARIGTSKHSFDSGVVAKAMCGAQGTPLLSSLPPTLGKAKSRRRMKRYPKRGSQARLRLRADHGSSGNNLFDLVTSVPN
jgi:hypothetical protein